MTLNLRFQLVPLGIDAIVTGNSLLSLMISATPYHLHHLSIISSTPHPFSPFLTLFGPALPFFAMSHPIHDPSRSSPILQYPDHRPNSMLPYHLLLPTFLQSTKMSYTVAPALLLKDGCAALRQLQMAGNPRDIKYVLFFNKICRRECTPNMDGKLDRRSRGPLVYMYCTY